MAHADTPLAHLFPRFASVLEPGGGKFRARARDLARSLAGEPGPWQTAWKEQRRGVVELVGSVAAALHRTAQGHPLRADPGLLATMLTPDEYALAERLADERTEEATAQQQLAGGPRPPRLAWGVRAASVLPEGEGPP